MTAGTVQSELLGQAVEQYRLRADAELVDTGAGLELRQSRFVLRLGQLGVGQRGMLLWLADRWADEIELTDLVAGLESENRVLQAQVLLRRLVTHSWLRRRLRGPGRPLLEVLPVGLGAGSFPATRHHVEAVGYRMSRFAVAHLDGAHLTVANPRAGTAIGCVDPAVGAALVAAASTGCTRDDLASRLALDPATAGRVLDELLTANVLVSPAEARAEQEDDTLAPWSVQELALHQRSRAGWHALPVGGTYRFQGRLAPEPLRREFPEAESVPLPVPDLAAIAAGEPPLSTVLAARQTVREHDQDRPITLAQLAEFLYRVQRLVPGGVSKGQEVGTRPYPCGGGICELEVYPVVSACAGLAPGIYHYESVGHRLERLGGAGNAVHRVLGYARAAAAMTELPQVVLVITMRVPRLMWKYEGIGYAMSLKHTGVLTELMYLIATAIGLAPCALGAGDAAAFAAASGVDPMAEPSVAEFVLGSRVGAERLGR